MRRMCGGVVALMLLAQPITAQRNQLSLEANPFRGTLGYARQSAAEWHAGVSIGFGFPQVDRTLAPADGDFLDLFHLSPFVRFSPSVNAAYEAGLRLGFGDLHPCRGSDCLPGLYYGVSGAALFGWRSFKVGPRLTAGVMREGGEPATGFLGLSPVNLLVTHSW